jgi:hypothetical protein
MTSNSEKREESKERERLFCKHYPSRGKHKGGRKTRLIK